MRIMRMVRSHSVIFLAMVVLVLLQGGPDVATPCLSAHHQVVKNMCAPIEHTRQPHYCGQYEQHVRLCSVTVCLIPWTTLLFSNAACINRRSTLRHTAVAYLECRIYEPDFLENNEKDGTNIEETPGICKQRGDMSGRRGSKSDIAQVNWEMVAETQGQYRCKVVCNSICHTMYSVHC